MIRRVNDCYQIIADKQANCQLGHIIECTGVNWSIFEKIVCIHYLPYKERFEPIKAELKRVGILDLPQFEFYYTVDNAYYKYALDGIKAKSRRFCSKLSQTNIKYAIDTLSLLKKLEYFQYKNVLIIEDDVVFLKDIAALGKIFGAMPSDFDVCNFDPFIYKINDTAKYTAVNQYFLKYRDACVLNASCIGLSRKAIQHIIKSQLEQFCPFDWYTWKKTENLKTYCVLNDYHACIQDQRAYLDKQYCGDFDKIYKLDISRYNCRKPLTSVAIVAIARLENEYINEWIDYHRNLGFCHMYIYDNSCGDEKHIDEVLTDRNKKISTIIPAYDKYTYQKTAYEHAYTTYGNKHDYMLFIDIDEFFTLMRHKNIIEYIDYLNSRCPGFQSARIHWEIYDDNNAIERDITVPVRVFFTQKSSTENAKHANTQTKSIVKCKIPEMRFPSVHYSESAAQVLITCNSIGQRIFPKSQMIAQRDVSIAKIRHYATKTIAEYMRQKMCRNDAAGYIVRDIENRFFVYCKKTDQKLQYYEQHKDLTRYSEFAQTKQGNDDTLTYWYWYDGKNYNAGDIYNKYLVEHLYKCKTLKATHTYSDACFCGSILLDNRIKNCKNIVGCGFQYVDTNNFPPMNSNYLAIRGKITKDILVKTYHMNIRDNILLCDPGILISYLYKPSASKRQAKQYSIGIIPHWLEEDEVRKRYGSKYHVISMKTDDIESLVDDIISCDMIVSSSLHGIIFSHSYGVPAYHVEFKDFYSNGNFKFADYYSAFSRLQYKKFKADDFNISFNEILKYDKEKRLISNPSIEEIMEKQKQFMEVLPYKEVLADKHGK